MCVCHGACFPPPPVLKNIQLPYKECRINITISISASDEEKGSVCLSLPSHKALDLYSHTYTRKSTTTDCASETVQWWSLAWMSKHHRLPLPPPLLITVHRLCGCGSSAELDRCAPSHPPSAIRLSKNAYSSLHTIMCTRHWVCFDFFPSGLIKRKGRKRKKREKLFRFKHSAFSKHFGLSQERVERQRGNWHNYRFFFRFIKFFGLAAFGLKWFYCKSNCINISRAVRLKRSLVDWSSRTKINLLQLSKCFVQIKECND